MFIYIYIINYVYIVCYFLRNNILVLILFKGQLSMEERIKYNVSRSITRTSVYPVVKREERIKKLKAHLSHFSNYHRNSDVGFIQMSPHLTQVMYLFNTLVKFYFQILYMLLLFYCYFFR